MKKVVLFSLLLILIDCAGYIPESEIKQTNQKNSKTTEFKATPKKTSKLVFLKYDVPMIKVDRPIDVKKKYGDIELISLTDKNKYFFSDSLIDATFAYLQDRITFAIVNKSEYSMKIIWDEAGLIEPDNTLTKIMHKDIKYAEREKTMVPSLIHRKGKTEDYIVPIDRIYYKEGFYGNFISIPGGWKNIGIIPWQKVISRDDGAEIDMTDMQIYRFDCEKYVGSKIGVLLPLQIQEAKNEYIFWFEVKSVEVDTNSSIK